MRQDMLDAIEKMYNEMFTPAEERLKTVEACLAKAHEDITMLCVKIDKLEERIINDYCDVDSC